MQTINTSVLNERREELDEFFPELLETYLTDTVGLVQRIVDAIDTNDSKELREGAHALKSSSGYMGAEKVVDLSAKIEARARNGECATCIEDVALLVEAMKATREFLESHRVV